MKTRLSALSVSGWVLALTLVVTASFGAFQAVDWATQVKDTPTTVSGYGITDAITEDNVATFTNKTIVGASNVVSANTITQGTLGIERLDSQVALDTELPQNGSFTLSLLGEKNFSSLDGKPTTLSGYGITDGALATDIPNNGSFTLSLLSEKLFSSLDGAPTNASYTFDGLNDTDTYVGHGGEFLKVKAGADGIEYGTIPAAGITSREDNTLGIATSQVTLATVSVSDIANCQIFVNGLLAKQADFTKVSTNVILSSNGDMPSGTIVSVHRFD